MKISNKDLFKVGYTSVLGQVEKNKNKKRLFKFIKENKIISITLMLFFMCLSLNIIFICNFFKIIQTMR